MNQWYFSKNGTVSGPFSFTAAKKYLSENIDVYGWNPSFLQWKPVHSISEFSDIVPAPVVSTGIPKDLSEKFDIRKQKLAKRLNSTKEGIADSTKSLSDFAEEIINYKTLTVNFSNDVKGSIVNIEKRYVVLQKKVLAITNAVKIAEEEMDNVVNQFENPNNDSETIAPVQNKEQVVEEVDDSVILEELKAREDTENDPMAKANNALKDRLAQMTSGLGSDDESVSEDDIEQAFGSLASTDKNTKPTQKTSAKQTSKAKPSSEQDLSEQSESAMNIASKSSGKFGMKGINSVFKSVFNTEAEDENAPLLSEKLKANEDEAQKETVSQADETPRKKSSLRRRRR